MKTKIDCKEVIVILGHSFADIEVPLEMWIKTGPGQRRFTAPIAAKCADDGSNLPLSVIPLRFRNNWRSRFLIRIGAIEDPWETP